MVASREYLALRPITGWRIDEDTQLPNKVWVKKISRQQAPHFDNWSEVLSKRQIRSLNETQYWFYFQFQDEPTRPTEKQEKALKKISSATLGCIVLTPGGNDGTLILCERWEEDWRPVTFEHHPDFHSTRWGRMVAVDSISLSDLVSVTEGITESIDKNIVRLINPLNFLENGLQTRNIHLRLFLWVTGLDALLMAPNRKAFIERLCNFLGGSTFVFPSLALFGQPKYRVEDVAGDLYDLRSCIAHGRAIPEKYRISFGFTSNQGRLIKSYPTDYQYRQVLVECALFLLCRALRKVFVSNLVQTVGKQKEWRRMLDTTQVIL